MRTFSEDGAVSPLGWAGPHSVAVMVLAMTASVSVGIAVSEGISGLPDTPLPLPGAAADAAPPMPNQPEPPVVIPFDPPSVETAPGGKPDSNRPGDGDAAPGASGSVVPPIGSPSTGSDASTSKPGPGWGIPESGPVDGGDQDGSTRPSPDGGVVLPDDFFEGAPASWCDSMPVLCADAGDGGPRPPTGVDLPQWKITVEGDAVHVVLPDGARLVVGAPALAEVISPTETFEPGDVLEAVAAVVAVEEFPETESAQSPERPSAEPDGGETVERFPADKPPHVEESTQASFGHDNEFDATHPQSGGLVDREEWPEADAGDEGDDARVDVDQDASPPQNDFEDGQQVEDDQPSPESPGWGDHAAGEGDGGAPSDRQDAGSGVPAEPSDGDAEPSEPGEFGGDESAESPGGDETASGDEPAEGSEHPADDGPESAEFMR